ncbi:MAG: transposase [Chloroflexi bacterium]|nr:transposase [Chloroflexota bacterium]
MTFKEIFKTYKHNPPHLFRPNAIYMVTGSCYQRVHFLDSDQKKQHLCETLFERADQFGWRLEAWAVLSNHYHFVAQAPEDAATLKSLMQAVHSISAIEVNKIDDQPGRKVWYNYWDSCINAEASYLPRLTYVHMNPVKHGIVENAEDYPFCSYRWFIENGDPEFVKMVLHQPLEDLKVKDDF